jgi:hypothetical protein
VQNTTEAEYMAMTNAANQAAWYQSFLTELGYEVNNPIPIHSDNNVTIVPSVTIQEHLDDLEDDLKDLENEHQEPHTKALVSPFEFPIQEDDIADDC